MTTVSRTARPMLKTTSKKARENQGRRQLLRPTRRRLQFESFEPRIVLSGTEIVFVDSSIWDPEHAAAWIDRRG